MDKLLIESGSNSSSPSNTLIWDCFLSMKCNDVQLLFKFQVTDYCLELILHFMHA